MLKPSYTQLNSLQVCTGTSASTTVPSYVTNSRPSGQRVARLRLPWIVQHVTTKSTSSTTIAIWLPATYRFDVTTPAMTVIDHNVFPHIMEAIYSYADYDTLLAMRPTSKTYRDWSDARLSEHVVVHVRRPKNEQGKPIWAAGSRSVEIHAPGGSRLPFFRSWNRGNGDDLTQWRAFGRYFARTTILDLADEGLMRGRAECIKAVCPELRTLRMLNNYESEREIANMSSSGVTFPGNSKNGTFVQFCYAAKPADPMAEGRVSRALFINPIPRGVRRCVVNLIGDMRDSKLIFIANTTLPPELRELVLVFHQIAGPTPEVKDDYQIPSATLHCFHSFAQLIAQNAHKCRITMAGALGVSERVYGFELMEDEEELRDTLVEFLGHIADEQTPMGPDEIKKANAAFHDIPWPSVPQYRKKLRPGQWENESVPRPWYSSPELSWYTK